MTHRLDCSVIAAVTLLMLGLSGGPGCTCQAEAQPINTGQTHRFEVGFNIGSLRELRDEGSLLQRIRTDGYVHVRFTEPFLKGVGPRAERTQEALAQLDQRGFVVLLNLSDFPYDQMPATADFGGLHRQAARLARLTNRFPPPDMPAYQAFVTNFIRDLQTRIGADRMASWRYEIGNEPDAPRFFWGTLDQFQQVMRVTADAIHAVNPRYRVGGAGFTARLFTQGSSQPYLRWAQSLGGWSNLEFISFHVYHRLLPLDRSPALLTPVTNSNKTTIISEWNTSPGPDAESAQLMASDAFMAHLIDLAVLCYRRGIDLVYVQKLMDRPAGREYQHGFFDRAGQPKRAYTLLQQLKSVVESGYTVVYTTDLITIRGTHRSIYGALRSGARAPVAKEKLLMASSGVDLTAGSMSRGAWVVAKN